MLSSHLSLGLPLGLFPFIFNTGMADLSDTSRWWFNCVCACVRACVCVSESVCPKTCHHIARCMMNG